MDLALAWKAGQELHNDYVITSSPDFRKSQEILMRVSPGTRSCSTTHIQERIDTVLPQAAIRFARTLPTILGVRDALRQ